MRCFRHVSFFLSLLIQTEKSIVFLAINLSGRAVIMVVFSSLQPDSVDGGLAARITNEAAALKTATKMKNMR